MTNEERKVFELALEALLKTQNEGFNLPGSAIREAITAIKEALAQPKEPDQDEVDIRSRLYQRIHELECVLKDIAEYTGEGPPTTDWQGIVKLISDSARNALEDKEIKQPEQEPVAYIHRNEFNEYRLEPTDNFDIKSIPFNIDVPLFKSPQRTWVGLTDEEIEELINTYDIASTDYAQAIEAKLKEKNSG